MCWIGTIKDRKVAQENIKVYKVFNRGPDGVISPFRKMPYRYNEIYETELGIVRGADESIKINEGFHSYETFKEVLDPMWFSFIWNFPLVCGCIIPKGSTYYINSGCIVSNKIIIINEICNW